MNKYNFKSNTCSDFYTQSSLDLLIEDAIDNNVSDIHIKVDSMIRFEIHGDFIPVGHHLPDAVEVGVIVTNLYKSVTGIDLVLSGEALDFEYEHRYKRQLSELTKSFNFRVNAAAVTVNGRITPSITIRLLNDEPPIWDSMSYGDNLWKIWRPENGLIAVSGKTGSGKSTLLASGLRRILQERENEKIIMLESPIEYNLHPYEKDSTLVWQRSVPKNVKSFVDGVTDALRQHPTIIVLGEARKRQEIEAAIFVCLTGHLTYITTHTNSVPETAHRLLNEFPVEEQAARMGDILYSARVFVNQQLLKSVDGKLVAIREILEFDSDVRQHLETVHPNNVKSEIRKMIREYGQPFSDHAAHYVKEGILAKSQLERVLKYENSEKK